MGESKSDVLQGTLDLMVLKTLETMGPLHGYGIARRIEQVSGDTLSLNQGTIYPALLRLEQRGWIKSEWGTSETNRRAKFYSLSRIGRKQIETATENWERVADHHGALPRPFQLGAGHGPDTHPAEPLRIRLPQKRLDQDLNDELRSHIELAMEENLQRGMSEEEARTAALRAFGGVTQIKESYRVQRGLPFLEVLWSDLRYAVRQLWKSPGFTLTTALTLAIGIGVNTAVFSMMDAMVLRPLAVPDLDRVVIVAEEHGRGGGDDYQQVALGNFQDWKQQSRSFADLAIRGDASMSLTGAGEATSCASGIDLG